jgi:hypothetical protein
VNPAGRQIPRGDGTADIVITVPGKPDRQGGERRQSPVTVTGIIAEPKVDFTDQIRQ